MRACHRKRCSIVKAIFVFTRNLQVSIQRSNFEAAESVSLFYS